jgi:tetratricopeptide (TPR) repeat protein
MLLQGDVAAARRELDVAARRFPDHHSVRLAEIYFAAAQHDWELAERHAETRLAVDPADTLDALDGYETLAGILMLQGRLVEAERHSINVLRLSRQIGSPARHLSSALRLGYLELRYRASPAEAIQRVERGLTVFPLDSIVEGDRPYDELARFFAAAGQPTRARELLDRASRTELNRRRIQNAERLWSVGRVALAEKRHQKATADLLQAAETYWCTICVLPDLARSYESAGNTDAAVVAYQRYLTTPWKHRFESDAVELGWMLRRLGELYESRGESAKAREVYTRLLRLWRRADEELKPVLAQVRQRLDNLR